MATYKAEFLAHYYQHHRRPMAAYTMGLIFWWARVASLIPRLANFLSHAPYLSMLFKRIGGIHPARDVPHFAVTPFKKWWRQRPIQNEGRPRVVLWVDTFNNYFHPSTAMAAVTVLEDAGYQILVPTKSLCCGRPLYDFGFLSKAKSLLQDILADLRPEIERGTPLVGLEPSCLSVFRDELCDLLPTDQDAKRLKSQSYLLSEFLEKIGWHPPRLTRKAIVHGHCHHKSVIGLASEEAQLRKLGLDYQLLDSGCCGMAGAFGFERAHYDISQAVGEHELLPKVRAADDETLVVTDGFSCREQIAQNTRRRAIHFAEVVQMALLPSPSPVEGSFESANRPVRDRPFRPRYAYFSLFFLLSLIVGALWTLLD